MLKFFDRYLLKEISPPFFIGLLVYTFVLLMNQVFLLSELFIARGVAFPTIARIFLYLIPSALAFAVPMSVLMGILAGLSRLSSDSEIVAFRTLGIRNTRLIGPVLLFALGGWLVTSALTLYLAPWANFKWVQTLAKSVLSKVQLNINPREFNESVPGTVIFVQDITSDNKWQNIFVHLTKPNEDPRTILARTGRLNFFPEAKRATLELFEGAIHAAPRDSPGHYSVTYFKRVEEEINVEGLFAEYSSEKRVREKDIGELWQGVGQIRQNRQKLAAERDGLAAAGAAGVEAANRRRWLETALQQSRREWASHWVEIHKKFALPFICLVFVLVGIPLGTTTKKGGRTSGFTISLGIILIYYVLITAGEKMALDGRLSAFAGMWGPNLIFLAAGAVLFIRTAREAPFFRLRSAAGRLSRKTVLIRVRLSPGARKLASWTRPRLALRFPGILDRYISRKFLAIFALVFLALLSISIIVTFFERIDNVYEHNKPMTMLFRYIQYSLPQFGHFILPVSVLTTALLALGLMTKSNEITAMKACGISVYRLILPVVLLAAAASLFSFALQERVVPSANRKADEVWNRINDRPPRSYGFLDRRWVLSRNKDRIYHYSYYDLPTNIFSQLSIYEMNPADWTLERRLYADKALLRGDSLALSNGWQRSFSGGLEARFTPFQGMDIRLAEEPGYFAKESREPSLMSYQELRRYGREVGEMGFETTRFRVDLQAKLSFPLVSLIMTLLAIPFAFSMGKRGALVGLGLSIAIAMIYWGALGVFKSLGYVKFLSPFLAAWGPNLLFAPIGLYLLFRLRT
ncbi:MAG: LPS export ABC transporter permease LptF [Candidatus Aminicenantes bacterium RBG_16_63_16]|nr:MAG: LPS export ABC transporter permease LptF [Candidatus Aminicenantes bacterium RBG_16_63_16]